MSLALLIDFGSTYTKLRAVDLDSCAIVASAQGPSTVTTDVNQGLDAALHSLALKLGGMPTFTHRLASSSAAGGLRMVTVGLVQELTAEAARQAALGAGAKLVASFAYRLTAGDVQRIGALAPDILLLCGGTDGGNSDVILHNARALAASSLGCPFVVAGNREAADEVAQSLAAAGVGMSTASNISAALSMPLAWTMRSMNTWRITARAGSMSSTLSSGITLPATRTSLPRLANCSAITSATARLPASTTGHASSLALSNPALCRITSSLPPSVPPHSSSRSGARSARRRRSLAVRR